LTFNESKCVFSSESVDILGYRIPKDSLQPDPEQDKAVLELPTPGNAKEQQRIIGLFAYYAQWIFKYSDKIKPLIQNVSFPLESEALKSFETLKEDLINVFLGVINVDDPFVVETDTSDIAVSATLNQSGRPVAFFSSSLNKSELHMARV